MEGHGDHWKCFGDFAEAFPELVQLATHGEGGDIHGGKDNFVQNPDTGKQEILFSLANPGTDLRPLVLLASNSTNNCYDVWSGYPFAKTGIAHRLVVDTIDVWENCVEARIEATSADGAPVGFFDTLYHVNRGSTEVGKEYTFVLAGLAYSVETIAPEPIRITDPEAVERNRRIWAEIGQELSLTADGAIEFRMEGAAILLPIEEWDIDEYQFQGPVREVSSFQLHRWTVHAIRTTVMVVDDENFDVILYVTENCLKGPLPKPGDDIRGTMWLQGYRAD
jgi:hypothetical protein